MSNTLNTYPLAVWIMRNKSFQIFRMFLDELDKPQIMQGIC